MRLIEAGPGPVELIAVKVADFLLVAGQRLHGRYAVVPNEQPDEFWEWQERWRMALSGFVTWSAPLEFSRQKTLAAGICSRTDYERLMLVLKRAGVIVVYAKSGTRWASDWDKRKFLSALRRREIEAPYPVGLPVPTILHTRKLESQPRQPSQERKLGNSVIFAKDAPAAGRGDRP